MEEGGAFKSLSMRATRTFRALSNWRAPQTQIAPNDFSYLAMTASGHTP